MIPALVQTDACVTTRHKRNNNLTSCREGNTQMLVDTHTHMQRYLADVCIDLMVAVIQSMAIRVIIA